MRLKKYILNEKTYRISGDVDFIYKKYFKKHVDIYKKDNKDNIIKDLDKYFNPKQGQILFGEISSKELKSVIVKKANKINPVKIKMGIFFNGSLYNVDNNIIYLSLNKSAINVLINQSNYKVFFQDDIIFNRWRNEFSESSVKGTIYHELSHWLNDTLHNRNIKNYLIKNANKRYKMNNINFSDIEIDAQVHAIKQLKRNYKKDWNNITWFDIIQLKPSFFTIFLSLKEKKKNIREKYKRKILKRLNRENLLGNSLKNSFDDAIKNIR